MNQEEGPHLTTLAPWPWTLASRAMRKKFLINKHICGISLRQPQWTKTMVFKILAIGQRSSWEMGKKQDGCWDGSSSLP